MFRLIVPWIQAGRPIAHGMIGLPLILGEVLGLRYGNLQSLDGNLILLIHLYGFLIQFYILYINDYADEETDKRNKSAFLSGGSRVLVNGKLSPRSLLIGSYFIALSILLMALYLHVNHDRPWTWSLFSLSILVGVCYSFPPVRLSYRGHGELLQAFGCGVLLPLTSFYIHCGSLSLFPHTFMIPTYLLYYAANIVTSMPDYTSDRACGKHTYAVRKGKERAYRDALALLVISLCTVLFIPTSSTLEYQHVFIATPSLCLILYLVLSVQISDHKVQDFPEIKRFVLAATGCQAWMLGSWIFRIWTIKL